MKNFNDKKFDLVFRALLVVAMAIYAIGLFNELMDIDSAQYALISKQMFITKSYLQVYCGEHDYLDKPPLLFWLSCLSFYVFGISDWAFRLPSVLVLILGIYSTYRFSILYYNKLIAKIAVLVITYCCAVFLMVFDVRTDTMLTGWVMFSVWQLAEFYKNLKLKNIIWAAIGIGLSMLTKGPIGLVIIVVAFSAEFIIKKQWQNFFRWQYLLALVIIAVMLVPMSIGLYEQFDLHPEKTVYNMQGPSGLRFFYWTQSFGRITGESYWNNNPDPFFLYHSFLWSFMPWVIFFVPAIYFAVKNLIKQINKEREVISTAGFVLIILFLSLSKYQLPHYTFCIHPFAAIITARYIYQAFFKSSNKKAKNTLLGFQIFISIILFTVAYLLVAVVFKNLPYLYVIIILAFVLYVYLGLIYKSHLFEKIIYITLIPFITLTLVLNLSFYPKLLRYQADSVIGKEVDYLDKSENTLIKYNSSSFSLDFYTSRRVINCSDKDQFIKYIKGNEHYLLIIDPADFDFIKSLLPTASIIKSYSKYHVTELSIDFLNPKTRKKVIKKVFLVKY